MLLVAGLAVAGFGIPLALSVQALYRDEALLMLAEQAARAAVAVPGTFARDNDLPELPDHVGDVDVALYDAAGDRVVGMGPAHADTAVSQALRDGSAQRRLSDLVVAFPISDQENVVGVIRTSIPGDVVAARTRATWAAMAGLAVAVLVAAGLLAARRSRSLVRPLARLRTDAEVIGAGGELPAQPETGILEIDSVHAALAVSAGRLNRALARERSFSTDLAHQLRTPLASLRLNLETEQHHPRLDGGRLIEDALTDVDRLQQTIDDILSLARDSERTREPHALSNLLRDVATRWEPRLAKTGRRFEVAIEDNLPLVEASPSSVRQILDVLVDNALAHGAGDICVSGTRLGLGAVVEVADHGETVLDPDVIFVRRSPEAAGSGIGLALARRLAEAEDLRLIVVDPGPGATFHVVFGGIPDDGADTQSD